MRFPRYGKDYVMRSGLAGASTRRERENNMRAICSGAILVALCLQSANAGTVILFSDASGLSAEAEFTMLNPTTLEVRLKNTSTGVPLGFDSSDQILTGISWDFGHVGFNGDAMITGGTVVTGPSSFSVNFRVSNFSVSNVGANADVTGEYGYGNMDGTGALTNFVTAHSPQSTAFGGTNLDGTVNIDGPQAGLISSAFSLPLGGLGAIQDEIIATLTLSEPVAQADIFGVLGLTENAARVEFGSDALFITNPEPASLGLMMVGALAILRRR